jgi:F0F1-type ATP synthase assembly protein I
MSIIGKVLGMQIAVTITAAAGLLLFEDTRAAAAALIGGTIGFASGWVYAYKMKTAHGTPAAIMAGHFRAEGYKFAITALLFIATFVLYREISPLPLFLTYAATLLVYWAALLLT